MGDPKGVMAQTLTREWLSRAHAARTVADQFEELEAAGHVIVPRILLERAERELGAWEDGFEAFATDDPHIREDLRTALQGGDNGR